MAKKIGRISNYLDHIGVAVVKIETGSLKTGDQIRIGEEDDGLEMTVESMQMDHLAVDEVKKGQDCGLKVESAVKKGSSVYKL